MTHLNKITVIHNGHALLLTTKHQFRCHGNLTLDKRPSNQDVDREFKLQ